MYKKVLNCLKAKQILPPAKVYTDFELNEINSLKEVFDDVIVEGCDTHFKRALRRNLGDKHLLQDYNLYTPLQNFVRKVWGCSLVPPEMVEDIWENTLKLSLPFKEDYNPDNNQNDEAEDDDGVDPQEEINTYNHNLDQYVRYLEFTWFGYNQPRTGNKKAPRFPIRTWNKYDCVINSEDTTTIVQKVLTLL